MLRQRQKEQSGPSTPFFNIEAHNQSQIIFHVKMTIISLAGHYKSTWYNAHSFLWPVAVSGTCPGLALSVCHPKLHAIQRTELVTMSLQVHHWALRIQRAAGGFQPQRLRSSLQTSLLCRRPSVMANWNSVLHAPLSLLNERSLRDH